MNKSNERQTKSSSSLVYNKVQTRCGGSKTTSPPRKMKKSKKKKGWKGERAEANTRCTTPHCAARLRQTAGIFGFASNAKKEKSQNPETSVSFSLPLESEKWQLPGRTVLTVELIADRSAYPRSRRHGIKCLLRDQHTPGQGDTASNDC